ncbi:MAG: hypothetical protein C0490_07910 [Marivirga sp.]|nr:hypothetical protein [Marivirga sp.]
MAELSQDLPCKGMLRVNVDGWRISYYLPGPDRRYKGKIISITELNAHRYIQSLKDNFAEYERLRVIFGKEENFSLELEFGMEINIGTEFPTLNGIRLRATREPISTKAQLDAIVSYYEAVFREANRKLLMLKEVG